MLHSIDGADEHVENPQIEGKSEKYGIKRLLIKEYGRYGQFQCSVQYCARCSEYNANVKNSTLAT